MRPVSDDFLLTMASMAAGLAGLFLVGVFFFIDAGFGEREQGRDAFVRYLRSGTQIVLVLLAFPILLSVTLVAFDLSWGRGLFVVLSLVLIAANIDSVRGIRSIARSSGMLALLVNEALGTVGVVILVTIPWLLGGLNPTREDLTWAVLIAFLIGFLSLSSIVLSAFDLGRLDAGDAADAADE